MLTDLEYCAKNHLKEFSITSSDFATAETLIFILKNCHSLDTLTLVNETRVSLVEFVDLLEEWRDEALNDSTSSLRDSDGDRSLMLHLETLRVEDCRQSLFATESEFKSFWKSYPHNQPLFIQIELPSEIMNDINDENSAFQISPCICCSCFGYADALWYTM